MLVDKYFLDLDDGTTVQVSGDTYDMNKEGEPLIWKQDRYLDNN